MAFNTQSDFTGELDLPKNGLNSDVLTATIARVEKNTLLSLLGDTLYEQFIADHSGGGTFSKQKFQDLYDEVAWTYHTDDYGRELKNRKPGIKEMLRYFIYPEFGNHLRSKPSEASFGTPVSENTTVREGNEITGHLEHTYNKGVELYNRIRKFMLFFAEYTADATATVNDGAGQYTFSVADTKYIYAGDLIFVNGYVLTVDAVVADTSIQATEQNSNAAISFGTPTVKWQPFYAPGSVIKYKSILGGI